MANTQTITAMSFNIWCNGDTRDKRANGVEQTIRAAKPDSVGLQEATAEWRGLLKAALGDLYGIACDRPRELGSSEGMPIFYLKEKYDLIDEGVFWLSETPNEPSMGWDAACPRIAGWALLRDKRAGFAYAHFNTHLDHVGEAAMLNGARLVAQRVKAMELPAVLTGDMNVTPGSPAMEALLAGGLTDLREAAAATDKGATFHHYGGPDGGKIIDYVLANGYLRRALAYRVIRDAYDGQYPSDHFAVSATFALAKQGQET